MKGTAVQSLAVFLLPFNTIRKQMLYIKKTSHFYYSSPGPRVTKLHVSDLLPRETAAKGNSN